MPQEFRGFGILFWMVMVILNASLVQALVDEGKVKYIGLSEATPEQIRTVHAVTPVTALEMEWSLFSREGEVRCISLYPSSGNPDLDLQKGQYKIFRAR